MPFVLGLTVLSLISGALFLRSRHHAPAGTQYNENTNPDPNLPGNVLFIPGPGGSPRWKVIKQGIQDGRTWWQLWAEPNAFGNATELFVLRYVDVPGPQPTGGRYFGGKGGDATDRLIQTGMAEMGVRPAYPPALAA